MALRCAFPNAHITFGPAQPHHTVPPPTRPPRPVTYYAGARTQTTFCSIAYTKTHTHTRKAAPTKERWCCCWVCSSHIRHGEYHCRTAIANAIFSRWSFVLVFSRFAHRVPGFRNTLYSSHTKLVSCRVAWLHIAFPSGVSGEATHTHTYICKRITRVLKVNVMRNIVCM